jgi:hypothetical protein
LRPWLLAFLVWPFLVHTVRTPQSFPKEIFLKGILAIKKFKRVTDGEDTIVVKSRRSAAIDFPDGGDSDGGVDNIKPPPTNISKRIPAIDFPDGRDSDGGPDNVPPPKKVTERDV